MKNKKGQILGETSVITWGIAAFLAVVLFAGLIYVSGILNDTFREVGLQNEVNAGKPFYVNMTEAGDAIWGQHYESIKALRMVAGVYILALAIGIIITAFLERKHPFMFIVYILFIILAIIFSVPVSNAYQDLLGSNVFGGELVNFTTSNFILINLPTFTLLIGALGAIGLFINLIRGGGDDSISLT